MELLAHFRNLSFDDFSVEIHETAFKPLGLGVHELPHHISDFIEGSDLFIGLLDL